MKLVVLMALQCLFTTLALPVWAHDPSQHKKEAATAPECSKLKDMDASKMDPNDPVMKAIQRKCKHEAPHEVSGSKARPVPPPANGKTKTG